MKKRLSLIFIGIMIMMFASVAYAKDTVTIKHSKGTTVVKKNPKKVAIFDIGVLDIVDALGAEVEIALPTKNVAKIGYLEKYKNSVHGGAMKEPDIEALYNFKPEVIFISGRMKDKYDELSKIAPTVFMDKANETYMEDFTRNTNTIAEIFSKEALAKEKLEKINKKLAAVKAKAAKSDKKALVILTSAGNVKAYGLKSRFALIHDVLGIKAVDETLEVANHGVEASFEYISKVNPDILFVVDRTQVAGKAGDPLGSETLKNPLVDQTKAAKNGKIIFLDPQLWYLTAYGLTATDAMLDEVDAAIK